MANEIQMTSDGGWTVASRRQAPTTTRITRGGAAGDRVLPPDFLLPGVRVAEVAEAVSAPASRGQGLPALDFQVPLAADERCVVAVRHPSGALTFHAPETPVAVRGAGGGRARKPAQVRFRIVLRPEATAVRGVLSKAVRLILLKLKDSVVDRAQEAAVSLGLKVAGRGAEWLWWKARGLKEGWFQVSPIAGKLKLTPVSTGDIPSSQRSLLLLHGTFSHAASAYGELAGGSFFDALRPVYGDRVFAYNHFTVSRSPEQNVRSMLEFLPARPNLFDVITHSRGGLVLRHAVELPGLFGGLAQRFQLGHAVLVAAPNAGTPIATPQRWNDTLGVLANILEFVNDELPDNPWTTAAELVANGLVWLANHAPVDLPGLASMDAHGDGVAALQGPPGPAVGSYSALAANFNPRKAWQRFLDCGLDGFFAEANDLVVPSRGSWLVDGVAGAAIPPARIGCFGEGGNLRPDADSPVHHLNFFGQRETVGFLTRALRRESQPVELLDPDKALPKARLFRGIDGTEALVRPPAVPVPAPVPAGAPVSRRAVPAVAEPAVPLGGPVREGAEREADDTLHLLVLGDVDGSYERSKILALYGSARVLQEFRTKNLPVARSREDTAAALDSANDPKAGSRFGEIIEYHNQIGNCLEGRAGKDGKVPELPNDKELRGFGKLLFDALLRHDVKRLYDVARSEQRGRPLNVVFTCNIPWIARLPWEFAYDSARHKFLITEEVHFLRNVLTSVPAERSPGRPLPLRMLIVVAQAPGTATLAVEEEEERVRHGFRGLTERGLLDIEVLSDATPEALHRLIQARLIENRGFDIVHFIGHGDFDREANEGKLLFTRRDGGRQTVERRTLRELFCGRGIQLVFLNACDTARDAQAESNRGIAQSLVEAGLPAVVANQYKVLDPSAVTFAEHFYWSLAHGASLGEAAREARIALNYAIEGVAIDWAVPVLYARDPDYRLCERARLASVTVTSARSEPAPVAPAAAKPAQGAPAAERAAAATGAGAKPVRVAVADLTRAYPVLRDVVERLNHAQGGAPSFEFRLERIVSPLGVWVRTKSETGAVVSYLDADRFSTKLARKPAELGADCLICITDQWMAGTLMLPKGRSVVQQRLFNLYGWSHPTYEHTVLLISTAGLSLPPEADRTALAFINLLTSMVSDFVLETALLKRGLVRKAAEVVHAKGASDCPFYMNFDRSLSLITRRLRFDTRCREKLREGLSGEDARKITALEAMLALVGD